MEKIRDRKVILPICFLLTERSKFMYLIERAILQNSHSLSDLGTEKGDQIKFWRTTKAPLLLQGRRAATGCKLESYLFQKYLRCHTKTCPEIMGRYSTTFHICLYFKYSVFTVHKVRVSKAVAIATNQGNHSNNIVLGTALIRD